MAAAEDKKKYKTLENVLTRINKEFISLSDEEVKRNNAILKELLGQLITKMKQKDNLFNEMYFNVFFGGSYYDGLRVGQPDEFDLDLLLTLPKLAEPELTTSNIPGFVQLQFKNLLALYKQTQMATRYKGLNKLLEDEKQCFLDYRKVLQWMEGVVTLALNDFLKENGKSVLITSQGKFYAKIRKAGPAFTLNVNGKISGKEICLDIDLVPCFEFKKEHWPKEGFRSNPIASKPNFFIVPKPIKNAPGHSNRYWRLSFQEQERELMDKKQYLKPTVKFLKKLRDAQDHKCISSYYIKTVALWESDKMFKEFWSSSLSNVFMTILKQYYECIKKKNISYYWNKNNNLLKDISDVTLQNMENRIKIILDEIEKNLQDNTFVVAKYLLSPMEYNQFSALNQYNHRLKVTHEEQSGYSRLRDNKAAVLAQSDSSSLTKILVGLGVAAALAMGLAAFGENRRK